MSAEPPRPDGDELYDVHLLDQVDAYLAEATGVLTRVLCEGPGGSERDRRVLHALAIITRRPLDT